MLTIALSYGVLSALSTVLAWIVVAALLALWRLVPMVPGPRLWLAGAACHALSVSLAGVTATWPDLLVAPVIAVGAAVLVASFVLTAAGVFAFVGRAVPWRTLLIMAAIALLSVMADPILGFVWPRLVLTPALVFALLIISGVVLLRRPAGERRATDVVCAVMFFTTTAVLVGLAVPSIAIGVRDPGHPPYLLYGPNSPFVHPQALLMVATVRTALFFAILLMVMERMMVLLLTARMAADSANRAKSAFIAGVSHELRTPLNIVNGFADLLARQPQTSAREAEWVEHIRHAAADLTLLVDDILDLAKLEAGMVRLRMGGVELQRFLPSLRGAVADLVHRAGLRLAIELPSDVPPIRADEGRLRQVMLNLLTNAVKYNRPAGSIEIKVSEVADERVRITVRDTGIGIPPDRMAELFQPFNRLGQDTGPIEGTGVGLALSRQLVDLMGGQIGLESDPGEGTTVWVEFPRAAALQPSPQSADPTRDRGRGPIALSQPLTVVYVDPAPAHASLMQAMAEQTPGLTVVSARFGGEALVALASHRPEVLITAPLLPDMTGVELLRLAREATLVTGVRSYVLSADATADAREMALHAGFDGYLTKPIDPGTLIAVLNEQRPDGQRQEA